VQAVIVAALHQSNRRNQPVAADFRDQPHRRVDLKTQQLEGFSLRQGLLELAARGHDFLGCTGVAQQLEQQVQGLGQRPQRGGPARQIGLSAGRAVVLPGVVGWQVKFARASGNPGAAANAHEPVVLGEGLSGLARQPVQGHKTVVELLNDLLQCRLRDGRIAPVAGEQLFLLVQIFQDIGFQIGPHGHVHDFEQRGQREVMVQWVVARHQFAQPAEQVFQPQVGPDAFIEWVLVQNHAEASSVRIIARSRGRPARRWRAAHRGSGCHCR